MRLINTKTLALQDFNETEIPQYCILSHTWGQDEVLYQDFKQPDVAKRKAAYSKIQGCCEKVLHKGIDWAWIDTACIDKSSSAELSEAINSMYTWYKKAYICFAYLADVSQFPEARFNESLRNSRWFTRGWTLQEMLAPDHLILCDRNWNEIGTKNDLSGMLSEISGIDRAYLLGEDLASASIAKRMSWVASRKTTRTEDIAYCLLGIFDVNMPLLYGEGPKAFIRLQEEIIKESTDQSLFAWKALADPADHGQWTSLVNPDRPNIRGILARSPTEFASARNIMPVNISPMAEPIAMTNKGLRIQMPLLSSPVGARFSVLLACREEDDFEHVLTIHLSSRGRGALHSSNWFHRIYPNALGKSPVDENAMKESKPLYIIKDFEGKVPLNGKLGVFNLVVHNASSFGYRLSAVFPPDQWNPVQRSIEPTPFTTPQVAALRFDSGDLGKVGIILTLGFTALPYTPFCNIATGHEISLEGSLEEIIARNGMGVASTHDREVSKNTLTTSIRVRLSSLDPLRNHIGVDIAFNACEDQQTVEDKQAYDHQDSQSVQSEPALWQRLFSSSTLRKRVARTFP